MSQWHDACDVLAFKSAASATERTQCVFLLCNCCRSINCREIDGINPIVSWERAAAQTVIFTRLDDLIECNSHARQIIIIIIMWQNLYSEWALKCSLGEPQILFVRAAGAKAEAASRSSIDVRSVSAPARIIFLPINRLAYVSNHHSCCRINHTFGRQTKQSFGVFGLVFRVCRTQIFKFKGN